MQTRREFMRAAAVLAGSTSIFGGILDSIARAAAIEPAAGSSFLDAEHVVILMQENRSFDHAFGSLRGVRGHNDPRAIRLSDGNPVWVQTNPKGEKYIPFRLDIKESKSTWMGHLPHTWPDQVDAANGGKHDRWLEVKKSRKKDYADMPLTLGFHTREDIPFYYALADAFTIGDQYFCSSLTGTTPNRLYLWTGTIREKQSPEVPAFVRNEDCEYGHWCNWKTFPERLEEAGVSWKVYQNELFLPTGLPSEANPWVANFGTNILEWFSQFNVRFVEQHFKFLPERIKNLPAEMEKVRKRIETEPDYADRNRRRLEELSALLPKLEKDLVDFAPANFEKLSAAQKSLHQRAFVTNRADPAYRELIEFEYTDGDEPRKVKVPKADPFHQFRQDVNSGKLPAVSWIAPPEHFSDHPDSAWYGQWFVSEVLNILTKNPEVWKKTIFILVYDENDGYFDHVPPFQAPHPTKPNTGLASKGIDTSIEHLELEVDREHRKRGAVRGNSIGLGFRVPMIVASPWTRGGCVCSQVFDHTSVLQFLEQFASHKSKQKVEETNISQWRRTICGNLTAMFQLAAESSSGLAKFVDRNSLIETMHRAQFKQLPAGFHALDDKQIKQVRDNGGDSPMPRQEPGVRRSVPLPYDLEVEGRLDDDRKRLVIDLAASNGFFKESAIGAPFIVYALTGKEIQVRHYTVAAGDRLQDNWPIDGFENGRYHFRVHGPNGFFREFVGSADAPNIRCRLTLVEKKATKPMRSGGVEIHLENHDNRAAKITIRDHAYGHEAIHADLGAGQKSSFTIDTPKSQGWHDLSVTIDGVSEFERRYAGRVETGRWSISDPQMGGDAT